jgi:sugar phosphate isomerase/epimerase
MEENMSQIKRSISFYSLQDEYATKKMTLEDIFRKTVEWNIEGIELISDQMIHNSPHPTEETLKRWRNLVEKYNRKLVCNDIFINSTLYRNRKLTIREQIQMLKDEIINAHNLGFNLVRLVSDTDAKLIEPALETAVKYNVTMALEIHAGMSFHGRKTSEYLEVMKKLNSPYVGIVVDMGIFCTRHPRVSTQYFKQFGLNPKVADYIDNIFAQGSDPLRYFGRLHGEQTPYPEEFQKLLKNPIDQEYAMFSSGYENTPLEELDEYMPYLKHIHGKCYEMTEENEEYSIPYGKIIKYLDSKKYNGYISTEYEGNRFVLLDQKVNSLENVQRHQEMLKKYIGE